MSMRIVFSELLISGAGENTPGEHAPDGKLREYVYTREIADMVVSGLRKNGIEAERIVRENIDVSLAERCKRVNEEVAEHSATNVLLVSIHCNAAGNGEWMNARGWSAYTTKGQTKSDKLAECLYTSAGKFLPEMKLRKDTSDGDSDIEESFYILKNTKCPAALTENLFQDNKEEVEFLLSSSGKATIASIHIEGIINYIKSLWTD